MSMRMNVHVVPSKGGSWKVKVAGKTGSVTRHSTQKAAIDEARSQAKSLGTDAMIHGRDGRVLARKSYGE